MKQTVQLLTVFFWHLSSGYSCSICSCTYSHQPYTRTPHSHHAYTNNPITILRSHCVLREITGSIHGPIDDGYVVFPLRLHAWEVTEFIGGKPRWETRVAIPRNRTRAGCTLGGCDSHLSTARFSAANQFQNMQWNTADHQFSLADYWIC
jgi:hypothetical protein